MDGGTIFGDHRHFLAIKEIGGVSDLHRDVSDLLHGCLRDRGVSQRQGCLIMSISKTWMGVS